MTVKTERGRKIAEGQKRRKDHEAGFHVNAPERECKACVDELFAKNVPDVSEDAQTTPVVVEEPTRADGNALREAPEPEAKPYNASEIEDEDEYVTVHFLVDGVTAFGRLFYRGQTLSVKKGGATWQRSIDKNTGESWLLQDADRQEERFKQVKWALGAWGSVKGQKGLDWDNDEALKDLSDKERARIEAEQHIVME